MSLVIEKILFYHQRNLERIGEIELKKQHKINSCNLMRNCITTELTNFTQSVMTFLGNDKNLYPEDKEFILSIRNYLSNNLNDNQKGYYN